MKKRATKLTLNRETLNRLTLQQVPGADDDARRTYPCYPPTYGPSCYEYCYVPPINA